MHRAYLAYFDIQQQPYHVYNSCVMALSGKGMNCVLLPMDSCPGRTGSICSIDSNLLLNCYISLTCPEDILTDTRICIRQTWLEGSALPIDTGISQWVDTRPPDSQSGHTNHCTTQTPTTDKQINLKSGHKDWLIHVLFSVQI